MRNITYKYNVGDTVELKPKHYHWADVVGLVSDASQNFACRDEVTWVDTLQGHATKCDVDDSGAPVDEAKCRELYLKALKNTYGKVPFESETVEVGSLLEFTEAVLKAAKEVKE